MSYSLGPTVFEFRGTERTGGASTLRSLSEQTARRARGLSDAVALLGRHDEIRPELVGLLRRITRLRELCGEAEANLARYIHRENHEAKADRARTAWLKGGSLVITDARLGR